MAPLLATGGSRYFYPRSPCGERPVHQWADHNDYEISIHALLAESDLDRWLAGLKGTLFLSTLSLRRATRRPIFFEQAGEFLSTLSLRRATTEIWPVIAEITISIHALLAESDVFLLRKITITVDISIHALLAESDDNKPTQHAG